MTMTSERPHPRDTSPPDLLTIREVARALRWNETTVRRHIKSGVIPDAAVVRLPHRGKRTISRVKRIWLASVLAGKAKE